MINKFENVWANSGDTEEPTDEKKDEGWVGGNRVPAEYLNFVENLVETRINELADRINTSNDGSTNAVTQSSIATGLWTDPWCLTSDTDNVIDGGDKAYTDVCAYFNADGEPRLLVLDDEDTTIEIWNPRTLTSVITSNDLADDLPAAGATWEVYSMCTDGTYAYVMARDTNASPDTHQIQAWEISESSSNWTVRSGWAATGTALPGTGNGQSTRLRDGTIIVASSTKLATSNHWTVITGSSAAAISIIDITDGTIDASGAGDCSGTTRQVMGSIASDGTNIFFTAEDLSATNGFLCSATIADPTAGLGAPASYPLDLSDYWQGGMTTSCGTNMIVTFRSWDPGGVPNATDGFIRVHNSSDADLDYLVLGQDSQGTPVRGDDSHFAYCLDICFDGMFIWALVQVDNGGGDNFAVLGLDVTRLSLLDTTSNRQLIDVTKGPYFIAPDSAADYMATTQKQSCTSDGRDVWCIIEPRSGQTDSGKIFRLPQARFRG